MRTKTIRLKYLLFLELNIIYKIVIISVISMRIALLIKFFCYYQEFAGKYHYHHLFLLVNIGLNLSQLSLILQIKRT